MTLITNNQSQKKRKKKKRTKNLKLTTHNFKKNINYIMKLLNKFFNNIILLKIIPGLLILEIGNKINYKHFHHHNQFLNNTLMTTISQLVKFVHNQNTQKD